RPLHMVSFEDRCSGRQGAADTQGSGEAGKPHGPRVLIVEDERISRQALAFLLEDSGFAPDPCATAEEALEKVDHGRAPAFALVDLDLPGMNGLELLTRLEKLRPDTIKILMTAAEGERVDKFR